MKKKLVQDATIDKTQAVAPEPVEAYSLTYDSHITVTLSVRVTALDLFENREETTKSAKRNAARLMERQLEAITVDAPRKKFWK
jgi:hypothetical protein